MKKEYIIGGLLCVVLIGVVAYAVFTFLGIQDSDTRQLTQQLPVVPLPLDVVAPEAAQPVKDQLSDQEKAEKLTAPSAKKTEGTSGVRITLKSGRVLLADACTEFGSQLRCDMPGGTVEVQRQDIVSITEVTIVKRSGVEAQPNAGTAAEVDKKDDSGKIAANANPPAQPGNGGVSGRLTPEQIKRLDQINERKAVLQPERERLIKEREQLHQDVKDMGMLYSKEQFTAINKRIAEVEEKISRFNEEVKQLNSEESSIIEAPNKGK